MVELQSNKTPVDKSEYKTEQMKTIMTFCTKKGGSCFYNFTKKYCTSKH